MAIHMQQRRDTALNWVDANPVLGDGELGLETDTRKLKCGDGVRDWLQLPYLLGTAAALNVGTTAGTVAAGNDSRIVGAQPTSAKDQPGGYAGLDSNGKLSSGELPSLSITDTFVVTSQAAMLALAAQTGDVAVRSDVNETFILAGADPAVLGNWVQLVAAGDVTSVNGQAGTVVLNAANVGADPAGAAAAAQTAAEAASLQKAANLSDVANAGTSRTNLGLGSAATHAATDFDASGAAATAQSTAQAYTDTQVAPRALDSAVVHNTGNETVAGTKTFSAAPSVPDGSFSEAKVANLASDLAGKAPIAGPFAPSSTGATAASRYVGATASGAPVSGTFAKGDFVIDQTATAWVCTVAGSPGTWSQITAAGAAPSGAAGGDLTGSYPSPTLATSGATAGSAGDATHVPAVTVDAKGRVTAGPTSTAIALAASGDATGTLPGALTLATANASPGTTGDATHTSAVTTDAKGRVTANTATAIQIAESQVTSLTSDLAAKLAAASNLSDVTNAATARSNLGLGAAALLADPVTVGHGGTGQTSAAAARASSGLNIDAVTTVADVNKTAAATDRIVAYTSLSAARTVTLPAANAVNPGQWVLVADYSNSASATNTISIVAAGSDTIVNNQAIASSGGSRRFISDGTSKWILEEATRLRASANLGDVQSAATSRTNLSAAALTGPFAPSSTGALAAVRFVGGTTAGTPLTGTFAVGDYVVDQTGIIWICTVAGTPGTWQQASGSHMDVYTTPGTFTWTKPQGAVSVRVILLAAGAGGGAGGRFASGTVSVGGGGGSGGGYVDVLLPATDVASTMTVVVPAGGAGATGQTADTTAGASASNASNTTFGTSPTWLVATGGGGGGGGAAASGGAGGGGRGGTSASGAGGTGSATGALGPGGASVNGWAGGGGGAGGGIAATPANTAGGAGGGMNWLTSSGGTAGTSGGGTGGNGTSQGRTNAGGGGGGGGSNIAGAGGPGGNGGLGGGGGGGGASLNGNTSGAGGNGGNGLAIIVTVF